MRYFNRNKKEFLSVDSQETSAATFLIKEEDRGYSSDPHGISLFQQSSQDQYCFSICVQYQQQLQIFTGLLDLQVQASFASICTIFSTPCLPIQAFQRTFGNITIQQWTLIPRSKVKIFKLKVSRAYFSRDISEYAESVPMQWREK